MIKYFTPDKAPEDAKVFAIFRPYVKEWFVTKLKKLTPPQRLSIPAIHLGKNTLVTAPTGSGKTISAFGAILNELLKLEENNILEDKVYCIYISPLKALINDIQKNLISPLDEIKEIAKKNYKLDLKKIRVGIRTGDVEAKERAKQLRKPPHILCTTPETLAILLSTKKFRENLKDTKYIIIDEIHELANSKRGTHLSLSLERLQYLTENKLVRIGLGATLEPLEEVAKYLVGYENDEPRECIVVDARFSKKMDIIVLAPSQDLLYTDTENLNKKLYEFIDQLIKTHTTTLIFTNTRSGTERIVHHLKENYPETYSEDDIGAHHSSVSKGTRLELEEKLKEGKLKVIVSSTSLELGIDIGYVDLVIQIGSPKSVSRALQRIGRAGHKINQTSKGRVICVDRDDLIETSVMFKKASENWLDRIHIVTNALDVLSQHILGLSIEQKWYIDDAYELIRKSYCYKDLDKETYMRVINYMAGNYHTLQDKKVYGKIWYDEELHQFGKRGLARMLYSMNIGTIPDEVKVKVKTQKGDIIGTIEEDFLARLSKGDIFVLAGKTYMFSRSMGMTAMVVPLKDKKPTVPNWYSEQLPLNFDLAREISVFRETIFKYLKLKSKSELKSYLTKEYSLSDSAAKAISDYFYYQQKFLDSIKTNIYPTNKNIVVETYIDEAGNKNLIFHALFGRRVNDALSRVLAFILSRNLERSIPITINDNGFILIIHANEKNICPHVTELFKSIRLDNFSGILRLALKQTELLKRKFRHVASRSLMILRNYKGYENPAGRQQISADRLFKVCDTIENFPIVEETFREIMEDYMDLNNSLDILKKIENKEIKIEQLPESNLVSPFAHNLLILSDADIVLMDDRKKILLDLHKKIVEKVGA